MRQVWLGIVTILVFAAFGGPSVAQTPAASDTPPPIENYAALPTIQSVSVSPDGSTLAYIRRQGTSTQVIAQTRGGEVLAAVETGRLTLRGVDWISPDHVAVSWVSTEHFPLGGYKQQFQIVDILNVRTRTYVRALKTSDHNSYSAIFSWRGGIYRGKPVLFVEAPTFEQGDLTFDVYRVDPDTGRGWRQSRGDSDTRGYVLAADGDPIARTAYQSDNGLWRLSARTSSGWREIHTERALLDAPSVYRGRTSDTLILNRKSEDGGYTMTEIGLADGALRETFDFDGEADGVYAGNDGLTVAIGHTDVFQEYTVFEPRLRAAMDEIRGALPGVQISLTSYSDDFSVVVVYVSGTGETGGYYLYDVAAKRLSIVGRAYPGVPAAAQGEVRIVRYAAADGTPLFGYLTLPVGRPARNLPVVILPHGGPQARDEAGYDWLSQGLASRGYAVFQPQFRGSGGLGQAFLEAGYGEWGRKMQSDVSDGLRFLATRGTVDPVRACIVGWSYGGYVALAGMTMESGTYRCAVAVAPVTDLRAMLLQAESETGARGDENSTIRYWKRFMGVSGPSDPVLTTLSPTHFADQAKGPILLIHGRDDTVVPFQQSTLMLHALGGEGPNAHLIAFDGQNHSLEGRDARLRMLTETTAFLQAHNPAD